MSGRHRIRYLVLLNRYVCSKRACGFGTANLTEALVHVTETIRDAKAVQRVA